MIMFAQAVPDADVLSFIPTKYAALATSAFLILTTLGRVFTSLKNDPGFMSAIKSVFMGSSTTTKALPNNSPHVQVVQTLPTDKPAVAVLPGDVQTTLTKASLIAICLLSVGLYVGCSTSQVTTAYKTETAIDTSVVIAWNAWTNYAAISAVPLATQVKVAAAFNKVKAAELVAIDATALAAQTTNTTVVTALLTSTQAESQALVDLGSLLASFGIKL